MLEGLQIRPATPSDASCISVLCQQIFIDTYATDGIRPSLAREVRAQFAPSRIEADLAGSASILTVAELHHHLVGYVAVRIGQANEQIDATSQSEIDTLYVLRNFKRLGMGSHLLREAERQAMAAASRIAWLTVWSGNTDAMAFYRDYGYTEIGITHHVFENESYENRLLSRQLLP